VLRGECLAVCLAECCLDIVRSVFGSDLVGGDAQNIAGPVYLRLGVSDFGNSCKGAVVACRKVSVRLVPAGAYTYLHSAGA
jgi:hypothetical protein